MLANEYIRPMLRKGVPPLFIGLRPLFQKKPHLAPLVGDLVGRFVASLNDCGKFSSEDTQG